MLVASLLITAAHFLGSLDLSDETGVSLDRNAIHVCVPRVLSPERQAAADAAAALLHPRGAAFDAMQPESMAMERGKFWKPGSVLSVGFMGGTPGIQARVFKVMQEWSDFANIDFAMAPAVAEAQIRIAFTPGEGSWSYIGTDILGIPTNECTMNLGWLDDSTDDTEVRRVTLHETGHTLGCIHEHQSPAEHIPWNAAAVYAYFGGPPNSWSKDEIDQQILQPMSAGQTQFTAWDGTSIMEYEFPAELMLNHVAIPGNTDLSATDKTYIATVYPGRTVSPGNPTSPPAPPTKPTDYAVKVTINDGWAENENPAPGVPAPFDLHVDKAAPLTIGVAVRGAGHHAPKVDIGPQGSGWTLALRVAFNGTVGFWEAVHVDAQPGDYTIWVTHPVVGRAGPCSVRVDQ